MRYLIKLMLVIAILSTYSCSITKVHLKNDRNPSSEKLDQKSCVSLMNQILEKRLSRTMLPEVKKYIIKEGNVFWENYYKKLFVDPWFFVNNLRRQALEKFIDINDNNLPAYYLNNSNEAYIQIRKLEKILLRPSSEDLTIVEKNIIKNVKKWYRDYERFDFIMNNFLKDYLSLDFAIKKMIKNKPKNKNGYPVPLDYELLVKGKMELYSDTYPDKTSYVAQINALKRQRDEYKEGLFFKTGEINNRQFHQAELKRQMGFLKRKLRNIVESNRRNGIVNNPDINFFISDYERLMKIQRIQPSKRFERKLFNKELIEEIKDFTNTIEDHQRIRETKKWYKLLTTEEKRTFKVKGSHGKTGNAVTYLKKNKWVILTTGLGSTSSVYGVAVLIKDFFYDEFSVRRKECVQQPISKNEKKYFDCLESYFKDKYLVASPFQLMIINKEEALAQLSMNEDTIIEYKIEADIIKAARGKYIVHLGKEEEFRKKTRDFYRDISGEVKKPNKTKKKKSNKK